MNRLNRQTVATAALLVLTVVPTVYVVWTAWSISRPAHLHAIEAELGRRLGLSVTIGSVRYPWPGEVVYRGVVLHRTEATAKGSMEVARADWVRLRRGGRDVTIEVQGLQFQAEDPRRAMVQVGALLEKSGESPYERVSLTAPTCDLNLGEGIAPYRLRELIGQFDADRDVPAIRASYRMVYSGSSTRCELNLTRNRKAEPVPNDSRLQNDGRLAPPRPGARPILRFRRLARYRGEGGRGTHVPTSRLEGLGG